MKTLQEKQAPIDFKIVQELVSLIPGTWTEVQMTVERESSGGSENYLIEIVGPDGHKAPIIPSDEIFTYLFELSDVFRVHGKVWSAIKYIAMKTAGSWRFKATFTY
jgi:hypothetical protein